MDHMLWGLAELMKRSILNCDIRTWNIMVRKEPSPSDSPQLDLVLIDFGAARLDEENDIQPGASIAFMDEFR